MWNNSFKEAAKVCHTFAQSREDSALQFDKRFFFSFAWICWKFIVGRVLLNADNANRYALLQVVICIALINIVITKNCRPWAVTFFEKQNMVTVMSHPKKETLVDTAWNAYSKDLEDIVGVFILAGWSTWDVERI